MPANLPPTLRIVAALGLGLVVTACGPIAFQDTVRFEAPKAAPAPEPEPPVVAEAPKPARVKLTADHIEINEKIQFEYDSAEIKEVSHSLLDEIVDIMAKHPEVEQVDIVGHTSSEGSKKHNDKLSTDRAAAVLKYLTDHGIDAGRLVSHGKGPSEPIADNDTEEGKQANRRVEFKITKMAEGAEAKGGARGRPGQ